jgi:hypothetical protein
MPSAPAVSPDLTALLNRYSSGVQDTAYAARGYVSLASAKDLDRPGLETLVATALSTWRRRAEVSRRDDG